MLPRGAVKFPPWERKVLLTNSLTNSLTLLGGMCAEREYYI